MGFESKMVVKVEVEQKSARKSKSKSRSDAGSLASQEEGGTKATNDKENNPYYAMGRTMFLLRDG